MKSGTKNNVSTVMNSLTEDSGTMRHLNTKLD